MGNEVAGVTTLKFKSQDGTLKSFQAREATKDDASLKSIMEDGKEVIYTKVAVKNDKGEKEYKYVVLNGGKEIQTHSKTATEDLPTFFSLGETKYDKAVDSIFDGMLCIDNTKPCTDGKDDGKISGWDKFKHFCKGCLSPLKAIIKHPIKTLAVAAVAAAAAIAFPVVGTALLIAGLVMGVATLGYGAYKAAASNSDAEAKAAWENIGTGTITTILSLIGLRKAHAAAKAKHDAFPTSKKYGATDAPAKPATKEEIAKLWNTTRNKARQWERAEAKLDGLTGAAKKAQLKKIQEAKDAWQIARDAWKAAKDSNPTPTTTPKTHAPEYTGIAKKLQVVGDKLKNGYETVKTAGKEMAESVNPKTLNKNLLPQGDECVTATVGKNRFDSIGTQIATRAKGLGFHDVSGKKMADVEALSELAIKHIHDGHHWQAKDAINYMNQIVKAGKVGKSDIAKAEELITKATTLLDKTKAINTTPGLKTGSVISGNFENMADNSATEFAEVLKGTYSFA